MVIMASLNLTSKCVRADTPTFIDEGPASRPRHDTPKSVEHNILTIASPLAGDAPDSAELDDVDPASSVVVASSVLVVVCCCVADAAFLRTAGIPFRFTTAFVSITSPDTSAESDGVGTSAALPTTAGEQFDSSSLSSDTDCGKYLGPVTLNWCAAAAGLTRPRPPLPDLQPLLGALGPPAGQFGAP